MKNLEKENETTILFNLNKKTKTILGSRDIISLLREYFTL